MLISALVPSIAMACMVCGSVANGIGQDPTEPNESWTKTLQLADFDGEHSRIDTLSGEWRTVNDNIMGGRSLGGGEIREGVMIFSGSTNTNGGGFSSIRANDKQWDLSEYDGLAASIRADGRRFVFHIRTGLRSGDSEVFYRGSFDTEQLTSADADTDGKQENTAWQSVFVPFASFVPMIRGRDVSDRIGPLDSASVRGIGLMIDDGLDGAFRLEVDWIKAVKLKKDLED
jgi:NADH dehydrogenase [ubiquinone] 1 alpha subcomplex assembly factor 1